jgi:hypothetical protein
MASVKNAPHRLAPLKRVPPMAPMAIPNGLPPATVLASGADCLEFNQATANNDKNIKKATMYKKTT